MTQQQARSFVKENQAGLIEDICALVAIRSVSEAGEGLYPYGEGCASALNAALGIARRMGFATENHEYHGGSVLWPGDTREELGMFAHLDVVHEGEGWQTPPYQPFVRDGWLYGRGSADNKGPAVTALYTLLALRESGVRLKHSVRLYLGCNEEAGMGDIRHYLQTHSAPKFSFTPDAAFSVCNAEKGRMVVRLARPLGGNLAWFRAGESVNAVAAGAQALLVGCDPAAARAAVEGTDGISVEETGEGLRFWATGRTAHAAFPEGSVNAAALLAGFLCKSGLANPPAKAVLATVARFADTTGACLGINRQDEPSGPLTAVASLAQAEAESLVLTLDIRYPVLTNGRELARLLTENAEAAGWQVKYLEDSPPMYMPLDDPAVSLLHRVCHQVLGDGVSPVVMGGGTYARQLPRAVGYGPSLPGQKKPGPEGHGGGHQPDECVSLQLLEDGLVVYTQALQALDKLE